MLNASAVGLLGDIAGASLLAHALILNTDKHIASLASPTWDATPSVVREQVSNSYDARFGLALLALGFLLQLDGAMGRNDDIVAFVGSIASVGILAMWGILRAPSITKRTSKILEADRLEREARERSRAQQIT